MSIYYISTSDGVIYELDATTSINYRERGTLTRNVIESGDTVSDHYVNEPITINISGGISDIKSVSSNNSNAKSTKDFIDGLRQLKTNKETFTFHFGEKIGAFDNCLFESLDISQNSTFGNVGDIDSFSVSAVIKQARIAERARLVPAREAGITSDNYQQKTTGSGSTEEPTEEEEERIDLFTRGLGFITGEL